MNEIEELRYLVLAAQREGNRALIAALKPLRLTPAQAEVLEVVRAAPEPPTVREIGERLVCESGSPSRLVAGLVEAGLLERRPHPDDARAVWLTLSRTGRRRAADALAVQRAFEEALGAAVGSRAELRAATALLRRMVEGRPAGMALARRRGD